MPEIYTDESKNFQKHKKGERNALSRLTDEEVIKIRTRYITETASQIWKDYQDLYTLGSFKQVLGGTKYSHLPIYKKDKGEWINVQPNTDN